MRGARGSVVTLAACVALLTATGCGSSGNDDAQQHERGRQAAASAGPGTASGSAEGESKEKDGGRSGQSESRAKSQAKDPPKVPDARLTPATGSFTKKQKRYLDGRVPKGIDPAAILAGGQEICERIARTAEVDREAAVDAVKSREIAGAKAAITHLCPKHKDLLAAAGV